MSHELARKKVSKHACMRLRKDILYRGLVVRMTIFFSLGLRIHWMTKVVALESLFLYIMKEFIARSYTFWVFVCVWTFLCKLSLSLNLNEETFIHINESAYVVYND